MATNRTDLIQGLYQAFNGQPVNEHDSSVYEKGTGTLYTEKGTLNADIGEEVVNLLKTKIAETNKNINPRTQREEYLLKVAMSCVKHTFNMPDGTDIGILLGSPNKKKN